jgi:MFS family permease
MIIVGFAVQALGLLLGVLAQNPFQFLMARIFTGAGQATYFACQQVIIYHLLPVERRAGGIAVTTAGAGVGSAVGFLLGKFLSAFSLGWKMPFVVLGLLSGAFVFIVLAVVPEPPFGAKKASRAAEAKPKTTAAGGGAAGQPAGPGWKFLAYMAACHFLTMYGFYLMLTWLPYYLETVRGLKGGLSAVIPVVMPLIMAPATVVWGFAADKRKSRNFVLWICLPIAALAAAAIPVMGTPALLAVALALYGATGKLVIDPILVATVSESTPPETRGSILATFNSSASLAMVVAPSATGLIAQWTGSFDVSFYMAGAFHLIALVSVIQAMRILGKHKARSASVAKGSVTAD